MRSGALGEVQKEEKGGGEGRLKNLGREAREARLSGRTDCASFEASCSTRACIS